MRKGRNAMTSRSLTLPVRMFLAVSAVLVLTTVVADVMAMRELRSNLSRSVSSSLYGMIHRMAEQLDQDLARLEELLEGEARLLESMPDEAAADFLARKGSALELAFDYGVLVVDASGRVTADSRGRGFWDAANLADEEFFQRTFSLGRPLASEPFLSPGPDAVPMAVIAVPLRDEAGRMRGIVAGGLVLGDNRILNYSTGVRASRHGQIGVFTRDGRVIAHSDPGLILEHYENPLPDSPPADGVLEVTTADGERALLAAALLRNADWVLAGVFPSVEVYAPIEAGFAAAHRWFALGLAACCALVWIIARRGVRDLGLLTDEVSGIGPESAGGGEIRVRDDYRGEAGTLADAVNRMLASLDAARRDVDDLSARLANAEERERRAIAADLHDSVCQNLALANMRLGGLRRSLPPESGGAIAEVRDIVGESVTELRSLTFSLSPGILYELGLVPALEWYAGEFSRKYALPATVDGPDGMPPLEEDLAIFLFRAAGELMTNAAKHAGATEVRVTVRLDGGDVELAVADDGGGFAAPSSPGHGFGLRNLARRARQFGGRFVAENGAGGGVRAAVRTPAVFR